MDGVNQFPIKPCQLCNSDDWWFRQKESWIAAHRGPEEWICGRCHPSPDPLVRRKYRVIKGNHKLDIAMRKITWMDGEKRQIALEQFKAAVEKLKGLCNELKDNGATDCLYISNGKKIQKCLGDPKFTCTVCPNDYWWDRELMELDSPQGGK